MNKFVKFLQQTTLILISAVLFAIGGGFCAACLIAAKAVDGNSFGEDLAFLLLPPIIAGAIGLVVSAIAVKWQRIVQLVTFIFIVDIVVGGVFFLGLYAFEWQW